MLDESTVQLWWAGKELQRTKSLEQYVGNNEKTKIVVKLQKVFNKSSHSLSPRPVAHRAALISVSISLGHASVHAVKATAEGWSTGSSAGLTFPLHSLISSTRREGIEYHF